MPDRERDAALDKRKDQLRQEWIAQQEVIKNEVRQYIYCSVMYEVNILILDYVYVCII